VAIRAYPANAKNSRPADSSTSSGPGSDKSPVQARGEASGTPAAVAARAVSSTSRVTVSRIRATVAVRVTPRRLARVSTATAATAAARCAQDAAGTAYAANVIAIAAHDAVLPTTKPQPARNPHHGPSTSRP
jgi:hypothetical protein